MKSFLLSALGHRYAGRDAALLISELPHQWLVWEPGAWAVPHKADQTTVFAPVPSEHPGGGGEALVLALAPAKGGTGQVTLGRSDRCDLYLNDATLSQLHLVFMRDQETGAWTVRDAGSTNGSWLGDARLLKGDPRALSSGARLQAGKVHLSFYDGADLHARLELEAGRGGRAGAGQVA